MKKEFRGAGKGMSPKNGYNAKKWYANYDNINWGGKSLNWCAFCGKASTHFTSKCPNINQLKCPICQSIDTVGISDGDNPETYGMIECYQCGNIWHTNDIDK